MELSFPFSILKKETGVRARGAILSTNKERNGEKAGRIASCSVLETGVLGIGSGAPAR